MIVVAYDGGNPPTNGSLAVTIVVTDANDNTPTFEYSSYEVEVIENVPVGSIVARVTAYDLDENLNGFVQYSLGHNSKTLYGGVFEVDSNTGDVVVKGEVDYEKAKVMRLLIQASDSGVEPLSSEASVIINVNDTNDNRPMIIVNSLVASNASSAKIEENQQVATFLCHVIVSDADSGAAGWTVCAIETESRNGGTVQKSNPKEKFSNYNDYFNEFGGYTNGRVNLSPGTYGNNNNVYDEHDLFFGDYLPENQKSHESKNAITFKNRDLTGRKYRTKNKKEQSKKSRHKKRSTHSKNKSVKSNRGDKEPFRLIPIINNEYQVVSNMPFDNEENIKYFAKIICHDSGKPSLSSEKIIDIEIVDVNDNKPTFEKKLYEAEILENNYIGSPILKVLKRFLT